LIEPSNGFAPLGTYDTRASRIAPHLAALVAYTALAVAVTWPLASNFTTGVVGELGGVDAYLHVWNTWWVADALTHGQLPFRTPLLFYPNGLDMFWQTLGFSQGVAALPITLLLGPVAGLNWTVISGFFISGYVTFLLARRLTGSAPAALVAGAIYAFSPFHLAKVVDGNVVAAIQWVPCYVLAFHLLLEQPTWLRALVSGLLLLWVSLGSWYYGLFCILYSGFATLAWIPYNRRRELLRVACWGAAPVLIWGAVLAPRILRLARAGDQELWDMRAVLAEHSADVIDFFLPNPLHPWWGQAIREFHDRLYPSAIIWNVSLGWVGLLLGGLGVATMWRQTRRWTLLLLASMIMAMGPALRVAGHITAIPLPFALIQDLPGIRANHRPNHMVVIATLMLAIVAAYGFVWLGRQLSPRVRWGLAALLVAAVIAIDGHAGLLRIVHRDVHPFYAALPAPDGALMPLPLYVNVNRSENLTTQVVHRWPILGGYVARPPAYPFATYTPGVRELEFGNAEPDDIVSPGWPELGRRALAAYAIRYVVMDLTSQKDQYFAQVRQRLRELGMTAPLVADASLEAYAIPRDWPAGPIGFLGAGWRALEQQPGGAYRWRWMGERAEIRLYNPSAQPTLAVVSLSASSYQRTRQLYVALDEVGYGSFAVAPDQPTSRSLRFYVPPGEHALTLSAEATPDAGHNGAPLSVRVFQVTTHFSQP
jgi:hypothetical protein